MVQKIKFSDQDIMTMRYIIDECIHKMESTEYLSKHEKYFYSVISSFDKIFNKPKEPKKNKNYNKNLAYYQLIAARDVLKHFTSFPTGHELEIILLHAKLDKLT